MATSIFKRVADALERSCDLTQLEARGTVRLALKRAGLEARGVTGAQMTVVIDQVLPLELRSRGVERSHELCREIADSLRTWLAPTDEPEGAQESPEAIFRRLARS